MNIRARSIAAAKHFGLSLLVAALVAALVFGVWYPAPYGALAGGFALFILVVSVDVISGPLLTFVAYDPAKPRTELRRDIGVIVLLQLSALVYGLYSVAQARPVFLALEGDRFRVVSPAEIDMERLDQALPEFRSIGYTGPRLVGVRLSRSGDADYQESVMQSAAGFHPSFRPGRWVPYDSMLDSIRKEWRSIDGLKAKHPESSGLIRSTLADNGLSEEQAAYLPLLAEKADPIDWVVIVERSNGRPRAFLPLDGW
ncbi:MAG: TfpX/TfpZ family type IV pilin accessory protein [Lautropia sp.]|nr:TfpX/TfpZ family type IV pilin accessory protein [Lautropia sp.]